MGALLIVALKVHGDVRGILTWIGINFVITFVFVQHHLVAGPPRRLHRRRGDGAILVYAPAAAAYGHPGRRPGRRSRPG